ncbi:DUF2076 domain-containing protein [Humitalea sp. 24SJ18S-53]|uniref:DUF2076 domain-containing protein n=1 Tax=Humitalea sp. 24SJ18S-53 TaxID=3422307 RepID=UPI003D66F4C3
MNDEERRIITAFVERVAGVQQARPAASPWGSVPSTPTPQQALPPIDRDADNLLFELFNRYPEARYRLTQTAFVTEAALVEAQNRIQDLEWQLQGMSQQAQAPQRGGLFGGMFGGGNRQQPMMPPRPQPMMPPGGNPGMFQQQRGGSGFLGTALMTAAGVAGGLVLGNALMGMMGGGGAAAAATTGGGFGQDAVPTSSPWTDPAGTQGDAGNQGNDASGGYDDQGGGYDDAAGGYDDGGGFDDNA